MKYLGYMFRAVVFYGSILFILGLTACQRSRVKTNLDALLTDLTEQEGLQQCVVYVQKGGEVLYYDASGYRDTSRTVLCQRDDIFRLASQTKAVTVVGLMMLYEQGLFSIDDPIAKYIPAFREDITIRHLLTHTSGICIDPPFDSIALRLGVVTHKTNECVTLEQNVGRMALLPLKHAPGQEFTYANNTDVLGRLIEILSGEDYVQYIHDHLLEPLDMSDTYFYLPKEKAARLVEIEKDFRIDMPPVVDYTLHSYPSPSAGLVGTIGDYAHFLSMILAGGIYKGKRFLKEETLTLMQHNEVGNKRRENIGFGFAWDVFYNPLPPFNSSCMRWGGMYGTDYLIDPQNDMIIITYNNHPTSRPIRNNYKQRIIDTVYRSLNLY